MSTAFSYPSPFPTPWPRGTTAVYPPIDGINWPRILSDTRQPVVLVNRVSEAVRLCKAGTPTIAVLGIGKGKLAKWLRKQGGRVHMPSGMN